MLKNILNNLLFSALVIVALWLVDVGFRALNSCCFLPGVLYVRLRNRLLSFAITGNTVTKKSIKDIRDEKIAEANKSDTKSINKMGKVSKTTHQTV